MFNTRRPSPWSIPRKPSPISARSRASRASSTSPTSVQRLLQNAAAQVARVTHIKHVKVLRYRPDEGDLLIEAGVGWKPGVVGHVSFGADRHSAPGRSLQTGSPVMSEDIAQRSGLPLRRRAARTRHRVGAERADLRRWHALGRARGRHRRADAVRRIRHAFAVDLRQHHRRDRSPRTTPSSPWWRRLAR